MEVLLSRAFVFKHCLVSVTSALFCLLPGPVDHCVAGHREENGLCIHSHLQKVFTDVFNTVFCILSWEFHDKEDRLWDCGLVGWTDSKRGTHLDSHRTESRQKEKAHLL